MHLNGIDDQNTKITHRNTEVTKGVNKMGPMDVNERLLADCWWTWYINIVWQRHIDVKHVDVYILVNLHYWNYLEYRLIFMFLKLIWLVESHREDQAEGMQLILDHWLSKSRISYSIVILTFLLKLFNWW